MDRPWVRDHVFENLHLSIDLVLSTPQFSTILSASVLVDQTMTDEIMMLKEVAKHLKPAENKPPVICSRKQDLRL